ncbi:MAG: hypothetical protein IJL17_09710 [Kiritimatiellae bacterium]|nr:hypothetical protein [Kiritimatiellia bacterium]
MALGRRSFVKGVGAVAAVGLAGDAKAGAPGGEEGLRVRFLGSGSACWEKEPRTSKIFRRYSSVLVDGAFLIDYTWMAEDMLPEGCRPDTVIYTHSHGDHYDPRAAVKLGVRHVYLQRGWLADAKRDFEKAVVKVGGVMPEIHPLDVCVPFNLGGYEILPLPGNHWTGKPHEQALIYKVTKRCRDGVVRLLYATDTSGLMSTVFFHGCRKDAPLTAVIMESTGNPVQKFGGMNISHSTASTVNDIFTTYLKPGKGHYMPPPGQPVYLTHIGYYEWGQRTFDGQLPPGLKLAHDGLEVLFKPA